MRFVRQAPQRIISLSPLTTEILYGVGAFDRVVAVSDYCTYPPAVKNLPRVGGWQTSSLEKIVSLRPDLIVMTDVQAAAMSEQFRRLGFNTVVVPSRSLNDTFVAMEQIGQAVGRTAQASALEKETRATLDGIRDRTKTARKRPVLCVVDRTPGTLREMIVATPGSFLSELVEIAGGKMVNGFPPSAIFGSIRKRSSHSIPRLSSISSTRSTAGSAKTSWQSGALSRNYGPSGNIGCTLFRNEFMLHTSQFVSQSARLLAEVIHPEFSQGRKMNAYLAARDVDFGYTAGIPVIRNVSISLARGKLAAIIGSNGCGKSTLIRLLAGILAPDRGSVELEGSSLRSMSLRSVARKIAYVPQSTSNVFPFTALEVVLTGRTPYLERFQFERDADVAKARAALASVGIQHLQSRPHDQALCR